MSTKRHSDPHVQRLNDAPADAKSTKAVRRLLKSAGATTSSTDVRKLISRQDTETPSYAHSVDDGSYEMLGVENDTSDSRTSYSGNPDAHTEAWPKERPFSADSLAAGSVGNISENSGFAWLQDRQPASVNNNGIAVRLLNSTMSNPGIATGDNEAESDEYFDAKAEPMTKGKMKNSASTSRVSRCEKDKLRQAYGRDYGTSPYLQRSKRSASNLKKSSSSRSRLEVSGSTTKLDSTTVTKPSVLIASTLSGLEMPEEHIIDSEAIPFHQLMNKTYRQSQEKHDRFVHEPVSKAKVTQSMSRSIQRPSSAKATQSMSMSRSFQGPNTAVMSSTTDTSHVGYTSCDNVDPLYRIMFESKKELANYVAFFVEHQNTACISDIDFINTYPVAADGITNPQIPQIVGDRVVGIPTKYRPIQMFRGSTYEGVPPKSKLLKRPSTAPAARTAAPAIKHVDTVKNIDILCVSPQEVMSLFRYTTSPPAEVWATVKVVYRILCLYNTYLDNLNKRRQSALPKAKAEKDKKQRNSSLVPLNLSALRDVNESIDETFTPRTRECLMDKPMFLKSAYPKPAVDGFVPAKMWRSSRRVHQDIHISKQNKLPAKKSAISSSQNHSNNPSSKSRGSEVFRVSGFQSHSHNPQKIPPGADGLTDKEVVDAFFGAFKRIAMEQELPELSLAANDKSASTMFDSTTFGWAKDEHASNHEYSETLHHGGCYARTGAQSNRAELRNESLFAGYINKRTASAEQGQETTAANFSTIVNPKKKNFSWECINSLIKDNVKAFCLVLRTILHDELFYAGMMDDMLNELRESVRPSLFSPLKLLAIKSKSGAKLSVWAQRVVSNLYEYQIKNSKLPHNRNGIPGYDCSSAGEFPKSEKLALGNLHESISTSLFEEHKLTEESTKKNIIRIVSNPVAPRYNVENPLCYVTGLMPEIFDSIAHTSQTGKMTLNKSTTDRTIDIPLSLPSTVSLYAFRTVLNLIRPLDVFEATCTANSYSNKNINRQKLAYWNEVANHIPFSSSCLVSEEVLSLEQIEIQEKNQMKIIFSGEVERLASEKGGVSPNLNISIMPGSSLRRTIEEREQYPNWEIARFASKCDADFFVAGYEYNSPLVEEEANRQASKALQQGWFQRSKLVRNCDMHLIVCKASEQSMGEVPMRMTDVNHFVVAVNDMPASVLALETATKLAKPCDNVSLLHIVDCHRHDFNPKPRAVEDEKYPVHEATKSFTQISRDYFHKQSEFDDKVEMAQEVQKKIVGRYRKLGFNVLVIDDDLELCSEGETVTAAKALYKKTLASTIIRHAVSMNATFLVVGKGIRDYHKGAAVEVPLEARLTLPEAIVDDTTNEALSTIIVHPLAKHKGARHAS